MAATIKLTGYGAATQVLVTEISNLASGSVSGVTGVGTGTIFDNTSNLYLYGDFELNTVFGGAPTIGNTLGLYWSASLDGSNYDTVVPTGTTAPQSAQLVQNFVISKTDTSQRLHILRWPLISGKLKFQLLNSSGVAVGTTSTYVALYPYNLQSV